MLDVVPDDFPGVVRCKEQFLVSGDVVGIPFNDPERCRVKELPQTAGISHGRFSPRTRAAPRLFGRGVVLHDFQEILFGFQGRIEVLGEVRKQGLEGPGGWQHLIQHVDPVAKGPFCFFAGGVSPDKDSVLHRKVERKICVVVDIVSRSVEPKRRRRRVAMAIPMAITELRFGLRGMDGIVSSFFQSMGQIVVVVIFWGVFGNHLQDKKRVEVRGFELDALFFFVPVPNKQLDPGVTMNVLVLAQSTVRDARNGVNFQVQLVSFCDHLHSFGKRVV
mmetsp:Transcript_8933/g.21298  ORF Transcript_8933/g.21298 Transcript_8933/m.21298 type:complete len:276 (-) Transcript_8933:478-1305(-)